MKVVSMDSSVTGEEGGAGSSSEYRTVTDAEVSGDQSRATIDSGDYADEMVALTDNTYSRSADTVDALAGEPWIVEPGDITDQITDLADGDPQAAFLIVTGLDFDADGQIDGDFEGDDEYLQESLIPGLGAYYLFGLGEPAGLDGSGPIPVPLPSGFVDAFGSFEDAEVVSDDGDTLTIRATRHVPDSIAGGLDVDCPPGCSRSPWAPTTCRPSSR